MTTSSASGSPPPEPHVLIRERVWEAPEDMFRRLQDRPDLVWLDSAGAVGPLGRYSYLCVDPFSVLELRDGVLRQDGAAVRADPFDLLAASLRRWHRAPASGPVPFMGGAAGLLGYGLARYLERLPCRHREDPALPALWLGLFDLLLGFDRQQERCWLISTGDPECHLDARVQRASARAAALEALLRRPPQPEAAVPALQWRPELSPDAYAAMVGQGIESIRAGDVFQVNLTMRHVAVRPARLDLAGLHLALRRQNPASFAAYIGWSAGRALCSASPERFLRLDAGGEIESRPIKGTSRRHPEAVADARAASALQASVKDRAENLMIVDLMRNDLSRVAEIGSVRVPQLAMLESVATLHHLVSSVTAKLRPDADAVALLRASFPAGSVTGAPKIRAMEIIDALEAGARGPYCGAIVWLGFDGAMDSSVVIRTLLVTGREVIAQAGGGIVADSVPEAEYREMLAKVSPLLAVFPSAAGSV